VTSNALQLAGTRSRRHPCDDRVDPAFERLGVGRFLAADGRLSFANDFRG
jgi:hypothetical protein